MYLCKTIRQKYKFEKYNKIIFKYSYIESYDKS